MTDNYEDLVKSGVIDPTKVTRTALGNAASVAILLLTSDALVAEKPTAKKSAVPAATTTCTNSRRTQASCLSANQRSKRPTKVGRFFCFGFYANIIRATLM